MAMCWACRWPIGRTIWGWCICAPGGPALDHFCLNVADFDLARVRAHLEAHGVEIGEDAMRYGAGGPGLSLYLKDPEGNALELRD
jgi:glyoxylase I family protein